MSLGVPGFRLSEEKLICSRISQQRYKLIYILYIYIYYKLISFSLSLIIIFSEWYEWIAVTVRPFDDERISLRLEIKH